MRGLADEVEVVGCLPDKVAAACETRPGGLGLKGGGGRQS